MGEACDGEHRDLPVRCMLKGAITMTRSFHCPPGGTTILRWGFLKFGTFPKDTITFYTHLGLVIQKIDQM